MSVDTKKTTCQYCGNRIGFSEFETHDSICIAPDSSETDQFLDMLGEEWIDPLDDDDRGFEQAREDRVFGRG